MVMYYPDRRHHFDLCLPIRLLMPFKYLKLYETLSLYTCFISRPIVNYIFLPKCSLFLNTCAAHIKRLILHVSFQEVIHVSQLRLIVIFTVIIILKHFSLAGFKHAYGKLTTFNTQIPQK